MAADASAKFAINLEDATSGAATSAARALEDLRGKIDADKKALREMQAAMKNLQGGTSVAIDAFRNLKTQIDAKKQSISESSAAFVELGGSFRRFKPPRSVKEAGASFDDLRAAALGASPALRGVASQVGDLMRGLGAGGIAGAAIAATVAVAALTAALGYAAVKLISFALGAADAARSELLLMEAAAGSEKAALGLAGAVDSVSKRVALGKGELAGFGKQLAKAKLSGGELESALEAVGIAASVGGDTGKLMQQLTLAKKMGGDVAKIADTVKEKWGGVAAKQMLGLGVQVKKAQANFTSLFTGVKIEPLLEALADVLSLLDDSTSSGKALKTIAEEMLNPLMAGLAKVAPVAKDFFRGMLVGFLKIGIAALTAGIALKKALNIKPGKLPVDIKKIGEAAAAAATAVILLGVAFAVAVGIAVALAAAAVGLQVAIGAGITAAIKAAVAAFESLKTKWNAAVEALKAVDLKAVGKAMMVGLANGIKNGAAAVTRAATNAAKGAIAGAKAALGIASPSKVFEGIADNVVNTFSGGVEDGAGDVERAAANMISLPSAAADTTGGATSRGTTVHLSIGEVQINGIEGANDPSFQDKLAEAFERVAASMGLQPEGA